MGWYMVLLFRGTLNDAIVERGYTTKRRYSMVRIQYAECAWTRELRVRGQLTFPRTFVRYTGLSNTEMSIQQADRTRLGFRLGQLENWSQRLWVLRVKLVRCGEKSVNCNMGDFCMLVLFELLSVRTSGWVMYSLVLVKFVCVVLETLYSRYTKGIHTL